MLVGVGRAWTASTFSGSGWTPDSSLRHLKNFTIGALTCVFFGLNTNPCFWQLPLVSIGGHHIWLLYSHGWWYHQHSQCNLHILPVFDPSFSGNILGAGYAKAEMLEMILTIWGVKGGKQTGFGVKDNCPVSMSGIQLHEVLRVSELISYFIHCGCAVMVPVNGIIEIMRITTEV